MKLLRPKDMLSLTGIKSKSTLHNYVEQGLLPSTVQLSPQMSGWPAHEVEAVLRARAAGWPVDRIKHLVKQLMAARIAAAERAVADALQANEVVGGTA